MPMGNKLADLFVRVSADNKPLQQGLRMIHATLSQSMRGFHSIVSSGMRAALSPLGVLGIGGGAVGLGLLGRKIVGDASTFRDEMNKSLAIMSGVTAEMRGDLTDVAREVSRQWGISNAEVAQSYFYLASAGLDASKSIGVLNDMAQFATAGNFSMKEATDMLTDALSALGQASDDPKQYAANMRALADQMVKGNTLANTSVQQLSEALTNRAAAAMKTFNVATEEGIGVLLAMADAGNKGRRAGQQFTMMLQGLTNAQAAEGEAFEKYGIQLYEEGTGKFLGMVNMIRQFEQAFAGASEQQMVAAAREMKLPLEAMQVLMSLMGQSQKIQQNYIASLRQASGETARLADANASSFAATVGKMRAEMADFWLVFAGDREGAGVLLPVLGEVSKLITSITRKLREGLQDRMSAISKITERVVGFFRVLREAVETSGGIGEMFRRMSTEITDVAGTFWRVMVKGVEEFGPVIAANLGGYLGKALEVVWDAFSSQAGQQLARQVASASLPAFMPQGSKNLILDKLLPGTAGMETIADRMRTGFAEAWGGEKTMAEASRAFSGFVSDQFQELGRRQRERAGPPRAPKRGPMPPTPAQDFYSLFGGDFDAWIGGQRPPAPPPPDRTEMMLQRRAMMLDRQRAGLEAELEKGGGSTFTGVSEMWKAVQKSAFDAETRKHQKKLEKELEANRVASEETADHLKAIREKEGSALEGSV